ncbi:MAG: 30S ribosomal protein S20 [Dehalococcoidia bacterium]|nr:30S ribosomal protein S20 [Dehalococcoidia bacterium]
MPNSKSVDKAARSAGRKRGRNRLVRSSTRTRVSKARKLISNGELELAQQETAIAISSLDKAVSKGVFHRNKSARLKSRLMKKLNVATVVEPKRST